MFLGDLIVILAEELQAESFFIKIQDYIKDGKPFIPIFSSVEKYNESTGGTINNPIIAINGIFLLSVLNGNEWLILNPGLKDEENFCAVDLTNQYSREIEEIRKTLTSDTYRVAQSNEEPGKAQ